MVAMSEKIGTQPGTRLGTPIGNAPPRIEGRGTPDADWQRWTGLQQVRSISLSEMVPMNGRVLIIAPHPDDEVLGCGGLLQMLAAVNCEVTLVAVTDGAASHPGSRLWPPERLASVRPAETTEALQILNLSNINVVRAGIQDGEVKTNERPLAALIARLAQPDDVIFSTWRHDGHPDHEASYGSAVIAASQSGARLIELPIWMWHWARPGDPRIPWHRMCRVALEKNIIDRKRAAVQCYRSQLESDDSTGCGPILPTHVLERLLHPQEFFFL